MRPLWPIRPASPGCCKSGTTGKSLRFIGSRVKLLREKYSASVFQKILIVSAHPPPPRGAVSRSSRTLEAGCDGREACRTTSDAARGRAKSRGPDPPTLGSTPGMAMSALRPTRREPGGTGANKPGTPGRARISRKPLRRECRCLGVPVAFCFACVPRVRSWPRCSLRPRDLDGG